MAGSNWILDKSRSNIRFKVKHLLVASVQGEFRDFDVEILENADSFKKSRFKLIIKTDSIHTRLKKRDNHLKSSDFLDVEEFPEIVFECEDIIEYKQDGYKIKGNLTIHGVTKSQTFHSGFEKGIDKETYGNLTIEADISREDYDIKWNNLVDEKWPMVDDKIRLYGNICLLNDTGADKVKGIAGRADVYGNNNYQVYSSRKNKYNGTFSWSKNSSDKGHWIFGICTGDSEETHYRALKSKLYVENLAKEYDHISSPSQFLRILHISTQGDNFLAHSSYDNNTFSLD
ncbi:MAG: YceI family protein, partial [Cyclobacteriaceae bacterium]